MPTATIEVFAPPMPIYRVSGRLRRTAKEPMTATITLDDGTRIVVKNVTIPPTDVDTVRFFPPKFLVHPCIGATAPGVSPQVVVKLPEEHAEFKWEPWPVLVAEAINCETTFIDVDGSVWQGTVHFDDCPIDDIFSDPVIAEAITATGTLEKQ